MTEELSIRKDFPSPTIEEWRSVVEPDLKGTAFEKKLVTKLVEGISIQPLYTAADVPNQDPSGLPGQPPFVRAAEALGHAREGWQILQEHRHALPARANEAILDDINHGAHGALVRLSPKVVEENCAHVGSNCGVVVNSFDDIDQLFAKVDLNKTPIVLSAGPAFASASSLLMALWDKRGVKAENAKGGFAADPLGTLASRGNLPRKAEVMLEEAASLAVFTSTNYPNVAALTVSTSAYDNAGCTAVQELAAAAATGLAYLRAMEKAGLNITKAARQIVFSLAVGNDQFLEIAKLRAFRSIWFQILKTCGVQEADCYTTIHARTSRRILTKRDPWVNMLRTTIGCFASAVGGADQVTVLPFDDVIGPSDDLARRAARNLQIVLQEEANLTRVVDPSGGCYYTESLTLSLAEKAWTEFQNIEIKGGMLAVLRDASFAKAIEAISAQRTKDLAKRKTPVTGVSEFPNLREIAVERPAFDTSALLTEIAQTQTTAALSALNAVYTAKGANKIAALRDAAKAGASIALLNRALGCETESCQSMQLKRFSQGFEVLRDASDAMLAKNGKRPTIFLANMGPVAVHTARAMFAQNFFEAGGFEAATNDGFETADLAAQAFVTSGASAAIVCASDAWYETGATEVAKALRSKGAKIVFLAGNPGVNEPKYREAGFDRFIFVGCDVLATLTQLAKDQGVVA